MKSLSSWSNLALGIWKIAWNSALTSFSNPNNNPVPSFTRVLYNKFHQSYIKSNGGSTRGPEVPSLKAIFPIMSVLRKEFKFEGRKAIFVGNSHSDRFCQKLTKNKRKFVNNSRKIWGWSKNNRFITRTRPQHSLRTTSEAVKRLRLITGQFKVRKSHNSFSCQVLKKPDDFFPISLSY